MMSFNRKLDEDVTKEVSGVNDKLEPIQAINNNLGPILILINPHSGRGKSVNIFRQRILPFLESSNIKYEVFTTEYDSRVFSYIQDKSLRDLSRFRAIVVVSGDGLVHETINAIMSRPDWQKTSQIPIGVIPTGSGNGLAYTLVRLNNKDMLSVDDAINICLNQITHNQACQTDLVKISYKPNSTIWSFLSIGWGLMADIDIDSEWLRRLGDYRFTIYGLLRSVTSRSMIGRLTYETILKSVKESLNEPSSGDSDYGTISTNDTNIVTIEDKFACVYAVYQSHISKVTEFAPKSTLTDQTIYLTYIRGKLSACQVIQFLLAIQDGSHDKLSYVTVVPVARFTLEPLEPSRIVVDGEVISWSLEYGPIKAELVPKAMNLKWDNLQK